MPVCRLGFTKLSISGTSMAGEARWPTWFRCWRKLHNVGIVIRLSEGFTLMTDPSETAPPLPSGRREVGPVRAPSFRSLFVEMFFGEQILGCGTAFFVRSARGTTLLSNWHISSGRHPNTHRPTSDHAGLPDRVQVSFMHQTKGLQRRVFPLVDENDNALWFEHPAFGSRVDVAALPIVGEPGIATMVYGLAEPSPRLACEPGERVSIVGFPFGLKQAGALAIWSAGFVASEPAVPYEGLPMFLVDCRARQGQSGSPVLAHSQGGWARFEDGSITPGNEIQLLGIYSGRVNAESDLGMVWKRSVIRELVDAIPTAPPGAGPMLAWTA